MERGLVGLERGAIEASRPALFHEGRDVCVTTRSFRLDHIDYNILRLLDHLFHVLVFELLDATNVSLVLLSQLHDIFIRCVPVVMEYDSGGMLVELAYNDVHRALFLEFRSDFLVHYFNYI